MGDPHLRFLMKASLRYQNLCPEQSRFLMQQHRRVYKMKSPGKGILVRPHCPFCFQWRRPDNHRLRIRPKRRASARVQKVLQRNARGKRLSLVQQGILRRFRRSPSALMATCHTCNKTTRYYGMNRDAMAHLSWKMTPQGTPASAKTPKCKTPKSKPRSLWLPKDQRTPCSTPRSISETPSSSTPKPASVKSHFTRLRKLLTLEDNQKSQKKGGLKDFLSAL